MADALSVSFRGLAPLPCRAFTPPRPAGTGNRASLSAALVSAPALAVLLLALVPATRRSPVSASYRPPPAISAAPASRPQAGRAKGHSPGADLRFQPCSPLQSRTLQNAALLRSASCPPVATARKPFQALQHLGLAYPVRRSPWKAYRCRYACVACYGACLSVWPLRRWKLSTLVQSGLLRQSATVAREKPKWFHPLPGLSTKTMAEIQDAA
jgi:hypothetical protein